jgi:integrase
MENDEDIKISTGFDRGLDYEKIKKKLVKRTNKLWWMYKDDPTKRVLLNKLIYTIIACIQLRNGSRISEAVKAFEKFVDNNHTITRVFVKISKSDGIKQTKTGEKKRSRPRYREMMWPKHWFDTDLDFCDIAANPYTKELIESGKLKKRVLDYLLNNFDCNTHSLRYAFINFCLYTLKRPMSDVAKFVGHADCRQMVTYSQKKNSDQIFEIDM